MRATGTYADATSVAGAIAAFAPLHLLSWVEVFKRGACLGRSSRSLFPEYQDPLHVPPNEEVKVVMHQRGLHGPRTAPRKTVQQGGSSAAPVVSGVKSVLPSLGNFLPIRVMTLWFLRSSHLASHDLPQTVHLWAFTECSQL